MGISNAVVSLWAEDVPACAHFYRDAIGLELVPHHARTRPHFDLGGCFLTIVHGSPVIPPDREPRFPLVAFSVPDLNVAIDKLRLNGVDLPWGVEEDIGGKWVMFRDPAGNLVELVEFNHKGDRFGRP